MDDEALQDRAGARKFEPFTAGPYHVIEQIGDGGMGVVYLAEQLDPIQRLVTLKTVRPDLDVSGIVQRFEIERQNLARMSHPNIAQILDADSLPDGRPYLVMEFVRGESLARYCFDKRLDIPSRLELVIEVCEAAQHAHQKGVVHKDLKPDNVLVTDIHGRPHIKVIDFGISKLLDSNNGKPEGFSLMSLFGTPQYMSPEQRGRKHLDVDTRTDVYSIGIMLYELLCSVVPVDLINMADVSEDIYRLLRPSEQIRRSQVDLSINRRRKNSRQLMRELRGDLDAIVLKAIAVDRNDRYQTPLALAEDLRRYLGRHPISIRRHESAYVVAKLIRRHGVVTSVILIAACAISILIAVLVAQVDSTEQARLRAEQATHRHLVIKNLLTESFRTGSLASGGGYQSTARDVLERVADNIDKVLTQDPAEKSPLLLEAARFFYDVSEFDKAEEFARQARAAARGADKDEHLHLLSSSNNILAEILNYQGKYDESGLLLQETAQALGEIGQDESEEFLLAKILLAERHNLVGEYGHAGALSLQVIRFLETTVGNERLLVRALFALAESHVHVGAWDEAIRSYERAWRKSQQVNGPDASITHDIFSGLAYARGQGGDLRGAEEMWHQELAYAARAYGSENQKTIATMANLGLNLLQQERWIEAIKHLEASHGQFVRLTGAEHPDTLSVQMNLAIAYMHVAKVREAAMLLAGVVESRKRILGKDNLLVAHAEVALAQTQLLMDDYETALAYADNALEIFTVQLSTHWRTAMAHIRRGQALYGAGKHTSAEHEILAGFGMLIDTLPTGHPHICAALRDVKTTFASREQNWTLPEWMAAAVSDCQ